MMFFETTIQSINKNVITDIQGRKLSTIGDLPLVVGEKVWTDGKIIFGHVFEGTAKPPIGNPGIPVLGDEIAYDGSERIEEHNGYYKQNGTFRKFKVLKGDAIVNDANNIKKIDYVFQGKKVIEAELSDNGDLFVVTVGYYEDGDTVEYNNTLWFFKVRIPIIESEYVEKDLLEYINNGEPTFGVCEEPQTFSGEKMRLGYYIGDQNRNCNIKFFKNNDLIAQLDLKPFADDAEALAWTVEPKIMSESYKGVEAINLCGQPEPPESFIGHKTARVVSVYIDKKGNWDAVIQASAFGYCFPYKEFKGSIFYYAFPNGEDEEYDRLLEKCTDIADELIDDYWGEKLNIEKYPAPTGDKTEDYILDKVAYYIDKGRFTHKIWYPVVFNSFIVSRVHNGRLVDTIRSNAGGGLKMKWYVTPDINEWDEKSVEQHMDFEDFVIDDITPTIKKWDFPIDEKFYFRAEGTKLKAIFATQNGQKILDVSDAVLNALYDPMFFYETNFIFPTLLDVIMVTKTQEWVDANAADIGQSIGVDETYLRGRTIRLPRLHYQIETHNDSEEEYDIYFGSTETEYLDGWYRMPGYTSLQYEEAIEFHPVFTRLLNGTCLLGMHNGVLLEIDIKGNVKTILQKLCNFRLREMKNIVKARK